jgi:hypothetical protein
MMADSWTANQETSRCVMKRLHDMYVSGAFARPWWRRDIVVFVRWEEDVVVDV